MQQNRDAAEEARLRDGVFQGGKAEIAEEMKRRLELNDCQASEHERPERATADRH